MTELSVAHRMALGQVVEGVPDRTLRQLALAVSGMPGGKARALEEMLAAETIDRVRRARGFAALTPLFRPRADGVEATTFPPGVLPRLWKIASSREPNILPLLDEDDDREAARTAAVCARLCATAAAAVRDRPAEVWPVALGDPTLRDKGLEDLAHCCDFGGLVYRALPSLQAWVGRPDGDQVAELRLLVRDASEMLPDGAERLMDILFAHLADASLILRLMVHTSTAAARGAFLSESELAVFVDRLVVGMETRSARIVAFKPGESIETLCADLQWCADVLKELEATVQVDREGDWGKRLREVRVRVGKRLGELLSGVSKLVDKAVPMHKVQTSGRMTRNAPNLDIALDPAIVQVAHDAVRMVGMVRNLAGPFGCEAQRSALIQSLTVQLSSYADLIIEDVNAGDAPDETAAIERAGMAADFLEQIAALTEARAIRRRTAVAGGPATMKLSA
ncbi:hypothetical protein [Brevundimonas goettingensis]|uniref:Uncharacterized protein n=1 Tax=Brevundimonas goettingensis TaxID=2774190 RepID=A0A975C0C9_9CAUL|nr:hypothetical protein [Brevundimonas goettingensis]QTC91408.1 hypothetical protein IFJ75_00255 [Brevundimonas goettingensis]